MGVVALAPVLLVLTWFGAPDGLAASGPTPPTNLRCEYLTNPLGIDVAQPRFAWVLGHSERGEIQSAYQVLVATTEESLSRNRGDAWDSGQVASDNSIQVAYGGKAVESGHRYYWKVRVWDKGGTASPYSQPAWFEIGLLSPGDWNCEWIGAANQLRTEFDLSGPVAKARAYIAGIGYYELHINGTKVGSRVLDPAWATYDKRVLYAAYDVTDRLHGGANAIGVMLGQGWFAARVLRFQLEVELANGSHFQVQSNTSWKATNGPVVSDSVYNGEIYDARRETPGWDLAGFDDSRWSAAAGVPGPKGVLSAEMMPPIRNVDTLVPLAMKNPRPGVYVYDMGQNISGWAELRVRGPRGTAVRMRFAELTYDDGMINRDNIRDAKAADTYILRGEGDEVYEPRFTYHGFRYVELTGYPGTPSLDSIRGRVVHSAVESVGSFVASKQILNQIQRLIRWSQLTNLFGIPTDCDQRDERQGWMGDAQVTAEEAMMNFDMAAFYTNFVRDIRDVQASDGTITDTVPHRYGNRPADPAWGTAFPLLCWFMWQQYGDRRILEENYDSLKKYVEFLRSRAQDHVLRYSYYGDWVAIEPTPGELVSDAYYYDDVDILRDIASILRKTPDSQAYAQLADQIRNAFNQTYLDTKTGTYAHGANGTQTADAMALFLGLVPDNHRDAVAGHLTDDITYGHNTHLTTGFIGVKYLMPALTAIGRSDLAYELAVQTTYPSWGYMVEQGATTLWELWQDKTGPSMNSHDHAMFGSVGAWFYNALGGINLGADGAGYRHIRIEPRMVEDLHWASATVETIRGTVSSSWTHSPGEITLDVIIPVNSDAKVVIPKEGEMTDVTIREGDRIVWQNGQFAPGDPGVTAAIAAGGSFTFDVGSGQYKFRLTGE